MRIDDCFELGYIVKTHGLKGQVQIQLDVDSPESYYEMESVFLEQSGNLIPFFFKEIQPQGDRLLATFEEFDSYDHATSLVGNKLFLPLQALPNLSSDEYYYHELVGMEVYQGDIKLGIVSTIYQPSSQYLLAIEYHDQELLIPIEDGIVLSVDKVDKRIKVDLPDGYLEIYQ